MDTKCKQIIVKNMFARMLSFHVTFYFVGFVTSTLTKLLLYFLVSPMQYNTFIFANASSALQCLWFQFVKLHSVYISHIITRPIKPFLIVPSRY